MYRRKLLLMLSALMVGIISIAAPRTAEQARKIAAEQARKLGITAATPQMTKAASRRSVAVGQDVLTPSGNSYYYVFNNGDNKGFTIVSGDDQMPEIVGYSDSGSFSEENMPANMKSFLRAYEQTLDKVVEGDAKTMQIVDELKARRAESTGVYTVGDILLGNIQWGQNDPYNLLCPAYRDAYGSYKKCATGCGATAMAQIMMYHKWPKELTVDIPDYITDFSGVRYRWDGVKVGPEGHPYDWDNMLENYVNESGGRNYTDEQALAVARLMNDAGRAVKMEYGQESTSYSNAPLYALTTYFDYDPDLIQMIHRPFVSLAQWMDIIKKDINERRPVFYYGYSDIGGHMFVCDGYDSNDFFHINWGWGGQSNGFFDTTILNPYNNEGTEGSGTMSGFDMLNSIIVGIQPKNDEIANKQQWDFPSLAAEQIQEHKITKSTRQNEKQKFSVTIGNKIQNYDTKPFNGELAYAIIDNEGNMSIIKTWGIKDLSPYYYLNPLSFDYIFPVGKHTVVAVEKTEGSSEWRLVNGAMANAVSLIATKTELSFAEPELLSLNVLSKETTAGNGEVEVEITNNTTKDYYGRIRVFVTDTQEEFEANADELKPINTIPLGLDNGKSIKKSVTLTTTELDKEFWLTFCDEDGYVIGTAAVTTFTNPEPTFIITGYSIDGEEITSESENVRVQTDLGIFDMAFVHNTAAPKIAIHVKNVGTDGTFSASLYNNCDAAGNPLFNNSNHEAVNLEIPCGETRDIISNSAKEGEALCLWTMKLTSTPFIVGDVPFGQVFNNGDYYLIYAYNDGTAGISAPIMELETTGKIYNIRGQRVKNPTEKGIYIIGKKKVLVK